MNLSTPKTLLKFFPRTIVLAALVLAVGITIRAEAGSRPPATPTAVATVDLVVVLNDLAEKDVLETRLQASLDDRQLQLNELVDRIKATQDDLKTLSPQTDAYRDKVRELLEYQNLAQTRQKTFEQIVSIERADMLRSLHVKIKDAIRRIAERDGWDIVLMDDSAFPLPRGDVSDRDMERAIISGTVLYRHESVTITGDIVTLLNNEFNAP